MRHHDRCAPVEAGQTRNAQRRTIGVGGVALRHGQVVLQIAQGDSTPGVTLRCALGPGKFGAPLAMGHSDGQVRARHASEQHRGALFHPYQRQAGLELLGAIAHKTRPMARAGNQLRKRRNHLAAVAHTQGETVFPREERGELVAQRAVEENALGPAGAGAQHIAIGEAATGGQPLEFGEHTPASQQITHVDIDRRETRPVKGRRHLDVAVDALLAQNRHARPQPTIDVGRRDVLGGIKSGVRRQPRVFLQHALILFLRALRVIAQAGNLEAGARPHCLQAAALVIQHHIPRGAYNHPLARHRAPQREQAIREAQRRRLLAQRRHVLRRNLQHSARLFGKQLLQRRAGKEREVQLQAAAARKGHFQHRGEQTAVRAIVIGEQLAGLQQRLHQSKKRRQIRGPVDVRDILTHLAVDLCQRGPSETARAAAQVQQPQFSIGVGRQFRGQGKTHVSDRRKSGHHQ